MKYLVRGKTSFLEAELEKDWLKETDKEVNPKDLIHFGTDIINAQYRGNFPGRDYVEKMEERGVDYLFISSQRESVEFGQSGKILVSVTAYKKK